MGVMPIVTNYHFLTDVVAGAYPGLAAAATAIFLLEENIHGLMQ